MIAKKILLVLLLSNVTFSDYKFFHSYKNNRFDSFTNQKIDTKSVHSLRAKLKRAKHENNWTQVAQAYRSLMYLADKSQWSRYTDSLLDAAKRSGDKLLIGNAFLSRGIWHYERKEHVKALDNYLMADSYISQTNDQYAIHKVRYSIAHMKYYLGFYQEAIALFRQCIAYYKYENDRAYLNSLHSLGLCYNRIGEYELSSQMNQTGLEAGRESGNDEMAPYFRHSEGINAYFRHHYQQAISGLTAALPALVAGKDFANEAVANFYIGKSYWDAGQADKAVAYFRKVDRAFTAQHYIRPDLRETYELLIDYYKRLDNPEQQLFYINQLLKADKLLNQNYKYLSQKLFRQYDTKKLLEAKESIEQSMKQGTVLAIAVITALVATIGILVYRHRKIKKRYRRKYEELMEREPEPVKTAAKGGELEISPDIVKAVLKKLDKFEHQKRYLEKDMTLVKLAALLQTNTKYASKIILRYRGKGTIEYISDLKTDHIIALLKTESKYRNYTNKALGEEAGFGSTQNFTKAFNARTGISPTYFIQELKKEVAAPEP